MSDIRVKTINGWKDTLGTKDGKLITSGQLVSVSDTKTVLSSGAYDAEDVVSEATTGATPWRFHNAARYPGGGGRIHDALILAETTAIGSWFSLFLHTKTPTCALGDDVANTAFIIGDIDIAIVRIDFPTADDIGTGMSETTATPSTVGKLPKTFVCAPLDTDLYGVLVIRNALDLADSTKLKIILNIEQF